MRERRAAISPGMRDEAGRRIIGTVLSGTVPIPGPGSVWALYISEGGEPNFMPYLSELQDRGFICCFPAFREGKMGFYAPANESDYIAGTFGIREPGLRAARFDCEQIDVMLVPCVAFDRTGARLGRGKGFYDRYLSLVAPGQRPITIASGYDFQCVDQVPTQPGDVPMDVCVTPGTITVIRPDLIRRGVRYTANPCDR